MDQNYTQKRYGESFEIKVEPHYLRRFLEWSGFQPLFGITDKIYAITYQRLSNDFWEWGLDPPREKVSITKLPGRRGYSIEYHGSCKELSESVVFEFITMYKHNFGRKPLDHELAWEIVDALF